MFQSRPGFSGFCDRNAPTSGPHATEGFQSRPGFSGFCDESGGTRPVRSGRFQSRPGFSGFCDRTGISPASRLGAVSIPSWVFWVLRPNRAETRNLRTMSFNPVLGFLGSATNDEQADEKSVTMFQSRPGFSGFCDGKTIYTGTAADYVTVFQSRPGFSGFCDPSLRSHHHIPYTKFQSRPGFSGFCDLGVEATAAVVVAGFQSRPGFSGFCDVSGWRVG